MQRLDLSRPTPEENLALDEALHDEAEAGRLDDELLRLWQSPRPAVILGRSSRWEAEVDAAFCRARGIPILRRTTGGASVVIGPGCLMYSLLVSQRRRPELAAIDRAHRLVLTTVRDALAPLCGRIELAGTSDLTWQGLKFSGNSLRVRREWILYHGTVLYRFPLELIAACLRMPPRQPAYRQGRAHERFVGNLPITSEDASAALAAAWQADRPLAAWPQRATAKLVAERYGSDEWNLRL